METEDEQYTMSDIMGYKQVGREDFYLVAWEHYGPDHNSWEPRKNIISPNDETLRKMKRLKQKWFEKQKAAATATSSKPETVKKAEAESDATEQPNARKKKRLGTKTAASSDEKAEESDEESELRSEQQSESPQSTQNTADRKRKHSSSLVVSRIKREVDGKIYILATNPNSKPQNGSWRLVEQFRLEHPQPLLDYLLKNLKFLNPKDDTYSQYSRQP